MTTATITIESLIADHGERLERDLELDGLAAMGPVEFIDDLDGVGAVLADSSTMWEIGEEVTSAVTYLRDALRLDDKDPDRQVLLRKADGHLTTVSDLV
jgi:hypothetical protein